MKNLIPHLLKLFTIATICGISLCSCSDDDDPIVITVKLNQTTIEYDTNGVWADVATNNPIQSQYVVFSHEGEMSQWGLIWRGFTPSRSSDTNIYNGSWLDHQFNVMSGGGMSGKGTPFLMSFWNSQENEQTPIDQRSCHIYYSNSIGGTKEPFKPINIYVNNSCYTYYTMKDGDAYCKKFEKGDYLKLLFHGIKADGSKSPETIEVYLADCSNEDETKWFINEWTPVSLEPLGEVTDIYCSMESSDNGQWGMNTPAYFCIDWLRIETILPQE